MVKETITFEKMSNYIDSKMSPFNSKLDRIEEKVDIGNAKTANIEGRLMMIPVLISSGISIFFFIINLVVNK